MRMKRPPIRREHYKAYTDAVESYLPSALLGMLASDIKLSPDLYRPRLEGLPPMLYLHGQSANSGKTWCSSSECSESPAESIEAAEASAIALLQEERYAVSTRT